ncbi:MAG: hypothetical protein WC657_07535 [Candidatus Paceibacterota bacterium]|jgi:hypothetical protein
MSAGLEAAPPNSLPDWSECAIRVDNSDFIAKRVAEGGYGPDADTMLATELHRFIYEYDDADSYGSAWFLHRLELVIAEANREASKEINEVNERLWAELDEIKEKTGYNAYCAASAGHRWTLLGYLLNLKHKADSKVPNDSTMEGETDK